MLSIALARHPLESLRRPSALLLHFGPEPRIRHCLRSHGDYVEVVNDISPSAVFPFPRPGLVHDLCALGLRDESVDAVVCVHVLEHILDDRGALNEIRRVLKPGGQALIMAPFGPVAATEEWGAPREAVFSHVRTYSANDFPERLAGFDVQEVAPARLLSLEARQRFGIPDNEIVYLCRK